MVAITNQNLINIRANPSIAEPHRAIPPLRTEGNDTMTSFVNIDYPTEHPGVARAGRAVRSLAQATRGFDGARGSATLLLAAMVSALLVVANQVIETWTE